MQTTFIDLCELVAFSQNATQPTTNNKKIVYRKGESVRKIYSTSVDEENI
jgi:hypothetical protein